MFQGEFTILRAGVAAQRMGAVVLFVAFLVAIFCGFFYHIANLVLGAPNGAPSGDRSRWTTYPVAALSLIVVIMAFWLPRPVYALVEGAARILLIRP
jgi:formate hydrogenlyase subunit 3/multisubunit Na+/H+ antiporter MnhD subunit